MLKLAAGEGWGEGKTGMCSMNSTLIQQARQLRRNITDAEDALWYFIRNRQLHGYKFKRQVVMGHYIVDFACHHRKLIIELDGGQHLEHREYDKKRTIFLQQQGYQVLRFWNDEVLQEIENVLTHILSVLETTH